MSLCPSISCSSFMSSPFSSLRCADLECLSLCGCTIVSGMMFPSWSLCIIPAFSAAFCSAWRQYFECVLSLTFCLLFGRNRYACGFGKSSWCM